MKEMILEIYSNKINNILTFTYNFVKKHLKFIAVIYNGHFTEN